jgi:hypothetical protein
LRGKKGDKNYPTRGSKKEEEKRNWIKVETTMKNYRTRIFLLKYSR